MNVCSKLHGNPFSTSQVFSEPKNVKPTGARWKVRWQPLVASFSRPLSTFPTLWHPERTKFQHKLSLFLVLWFLPAGGWTPAAIVQTPCVLLHLSRKANKSETAPPSVAAGSSRREPKRANKPSTWRERHESDDFPTKNSHVWPNQRIKSTIKSMIRSIVGKLDLRVRWESWYHTCLINMKYSPL